MAPTVVVPPIAEPVLPSALVGPDELCIVKSGVGLEGDPEIIIVPAA